MAYSVPEDVLYFHDDVTRAGATNVFPPGPWNSTNEALNEYLGGAGSYVVGLGVLGGLLAAFFFVFYIFALFRCCCLRNADNPFTCIVNILTCCCVCCRSKPSESARLNPTCCRRLNVFAFVGLGVLFVALAFGAAGPGGGMSLGAADMVTALSNGLKHFSDATKQAGGIEDRADVGARRARDLRASGQSNPADKAAATTVAETFSAVADAIGAVELTAGNATRNFNALDNSVDGVEAYPRTVGVGAAVAMAIVVGLFMVTAFVPHTCCRISHVLLSFALVIILFLVWLMAGAIFSGALVASDFCAAPGPTASNFISGIPRDLVDPLMLDSARYYVTCTTASPDVSVNASVVGLLDRAQGNLTAAPVRSAVTRIASRVPSYGGDARAAAIDVNTTYSDITTDGGLLPRLQADLSCTRVDRLFYDVVIPLCVDIIGNNARDFVNVVVAGAFFLTIFLGVNATFLIEHPVEFAKKAAEAKAREEAAARTGASSASGAAARPAYDGADV